MTATLRLEERDLLNDVFIDEQRQLLAQVGGQLVYDGILIKHRLLRPQVNVVLPVLGGSPMVKGLRKSQGESDCAIAHIGPLLRVCSS